jgi:hypothetical protein
MKKLILLIFFIPILNTNLFSQGLIPVSIAEYKMTPSVSFDEFGFTSMPESYSMERYVPSVQKQDGNSCTGFSVFYYGLSTQYNFNLKITDPIDKIGHSFDPYFAYTIINDKNSESNFQCNATNKMKDVLGVLESKGAKKQFFNPLTECYSSSSNFTNESMIERYTLPYSVESYRKIPSLGSNLSVSITKRKINDNQPVIIGAWFPNSFEKDVSDDGEYNTGDWELNNFIKFKNNNSPSEDEISVFTKNYYGHALTIVGYDDNIYGGAFRVVNSWGDEWGDGGYFWLKYKDFKIITTEAYILDLSSTINHTKNPQFNFDNFQRISFEDEAYYEGYVNQGKRNGQGIYSFYSEEGRINLIGNWENDRMNGFFTLINSLDEIYYGIYKDGVYVESSIEYGFNDEDEESLKNQEKAREYWAKYKGNKKIRKSRTIITKPRNKA